MALEIQEFSDQYELLARLHGTSPAELRERDARRAQPLRRWLAIHDGFPVGTVMAWLRPDRRMFLMFTCRDSSAYGPLADTAANSLSRSLYAAVDGDDDALGALQAAGFEIEEISERFRIRFDAALKMIRRARLPPGFSIQSADAVDEDRLFLLDNEIRQGVSGTDGWHGDRQWFHDEIAEAPPFDPSAYLVAVDESSGGYAGLVRVWRNPTGPRFGLIGVRPQYRATLVGPALLKQALAAASSWGEPTFTAETSLTNRTIHPRMQRLSAESLGKSIQLVRR